MYKTNTLTALCATIALTGIVSADIQKKENHRRVFSADVRSLDGSDNNRKNSQAGSVDTVYTREAPANYTDGVGEPYAGPNARYISNRIFADNAQNIFHQTM